jgi:hypothetical protein
VLVFGMSLTGKRILINLTRRRERRRGTKKSILIAARFRLKSTSGDGSKILKIPCVFRVFRVFALKKSLLENYHPNRRGKFFCGALKLISQKGETGMLSKILGQIFGTGSGDQQNAVSNDRSVTNALAPIAGISLERYAELCAKMANTPNDDDAFAAGAEADGVSREDWTAARAGWNERMENTATAGTVALAYMPLYQAALAKYGGARATATFEEYIEMSALINSDLKGDGARPKDLDAMYAKFGINPQKWSQISTDWVDKLTKNPQLAAEYAEKCRLRIKELDNEFLLQNSR